MLLCVDSTPPNILIILIVLSYLLRIVICVTNQHSHCQPYDIHDFVMLDFYLSFIRQTMIPTNVHEHVQYTVMHTTYKKPEMTWFYSVIFMIIEKNRNTFLTHFLITNFEIRSHIWYTYTCMHWFVSYIVTETESL